MAIKSGKRDRTTDADFNARNGKARVTIWLDLDVLDEARRQAATGHKGKYQSLINEKLREILLEESEDDVIERIENLERVVFKKRA